MTRSTYRCDCGETYTRIIWSGIADNGVPPGWKWDYTRAPTGAPQCPNCRKLKEGSAS